MKNTITIDVRELVDKIQVQDRRIADLERYVMELLQRVQKLDAESRIRTEPTPIFTGVPLGKRLNER